MSKLLPIAFLALASLASAQDWEVQEPVELVKVPAPPQARNSLHTFPIGVVWLKSVPYLAVTMGMKTDRVRVVLWRGGKSWERVGPEHTGLNFPTTVALPEHVGILASAGKDTRGGYGNHITCVRLKTDGTSAGEVTVATPKKATDRLTISGALVSGDLVSVFLLQERRGQPKNELLFVRSRDGGASFGEPVSMGPTTMHEDVSRLGCLQWSAKDLARFVAGREGGIRLYRSADGGTSWKQEAVKLTDDLGATRRVPLKTVQGEGWAGIVYLAASEGSKGRYLFSRSTDRGATWAKGVPISKEVKLSDPSTFVQLAATGNRLAFSFLEVFGSWTKGEFSSRLYLSGDGGKVWTDAGGVKLHGFSLFNALSPAPKGDRFLYATATWLGEPDDMSNLLRVHEIKPEN